MTYHIHKIANRKSEAGVTLLLSMLLLSAITAISFSLATIVFIESRASSDVQRTEPALYGTLAVLEDASFDIKRGAGNPRSSNIDCLSTTCVTMESTVKAERDEAITEKVTTASSDYSNTTNIYYLINPDDPYTDADENSSPDAGYGRVRLTNVGSVPVKVMMCVLAAGDCFSDPALQAIPETILNPGGATVEYSVTNDSFMPTSSYQIYLVYAGGGTDDAYIKIETFASDGATPKGIPYFGQKLLDVSAHYLGLTRRYRALIPEQ